MFISDSLADGGAQRVMSILASTAADLGADVSLVLIRQKEKIYTVSDKVKIYELKTESNKNKILSRIRQLHYLIKDSEATTLIPFLPIISLYTFIANIGVGKKIIVSERADPKVTVFAKGLSWKDRIAYAIKKMGLYRQAHWIVFQTPDAQRCYSKKVQRKSSIIPNPLNLDQLPFPFEGKREHIIVAVGRLAEEKNFSLLIHAFAEFHKIYKDYKLIIYGDGPLKKVLNAEIKSLQLESYVKLPGFVPSVDEKMYKSAMYISTSNHEGISNSMLEALGMGIPTIVTDCPIGGSKMFVTTDKNGILIPMNDKKSLVNAMKKIADDAKYASSLSQNAVQIRHDLDAITISKKWMDLI